jgi:hypothetical protein
VFVVYTDVGRRPWGMFEIGNGLLGELSDFDASVHGRDLDPPRQQSQVQVRSTKISETDVQG